MALTTLVSDEFERKCQRCGVTKLEHDNSPDGIEYTDPSAYQDFLTLSGKFKDGNKSVGDRWSYYRRTCKSMI